MGGWHEDTEKCCIQVVFESLEKGLSDSDNTHKRQKNDKPSNNTWMQDNFLHLNEDQCICKDARITGKINKWSIFKSKH